MVFPIKAIILLILKPSINVCFQEGREDDARQRSFSPRGGSGFRQALRRARQNLKLALNPTMNWLKMLVRNAQVMFRLQSQKGNDWVKG